MTWRSEAQTDRCDSDAAGIGISALPACQRTAAAAKERHRPDKPVHSRQRMGNCCACLKSAGAVDGSSVEMKQRSKGGGADGGGKMAPSLTISRRMSAPSVTIDGEMVVSAAL